MVMDVKRASTPQPAPSELGAQRGQPVGSPPSLEAKVAVAIPVAAVPNGSWSATGASKTSLTPVATSVAVVAAPAAPSTAEASKQLAADFGQKFEGLKHEAMALAATPNEPQLKALMTRATSASNELQAAAQAQLGKGAAEFLKTQPDLGQVRAELTALSTPKATAWSSLTEGMAKPFHELGKAFHDKPIVTSLEVAGGLAVGVGVAIAAPVVAGVAAVGAAAYTGGKLAVSAYEAATSKTEAERNQHLVETGANLTGFALAAPGLGATKVVVAGFSAASKAETAVEAVRTFVTYGGKLAGTADAATVVNEAGKAAGFKDVTPQYASSGFGKVAQAPDGSLHAVAVAGDAHDALKQSLALANSTGKPVTLSLNGQTLAVKPGGSLDEVMKRFADGQAAQAAANAAAAQAAAQARAAKLEAFEASGGKVSTKAPASTEFEAQARYPRQGEETLYLLTPKQLEALPKGTELVTIDGKKVLAGIDSLSGDTRGGMTAYGFTRSNLSEAQQYTQAARYARQFKDVTHNYSSSGFGRITEGPDGALNTYAVSGFVEDAVKKSIALAKSSGKPVNLEVNGLTLQARAGSTVDEVMKPLTDVLAKATSDGKAAALAEAQARAGRLSDFEAAGGKVSTSVPPGMKFDARGIISEAGGEGDLYLLTPAQLEALPQGTQLTSVTGTKYVKGVDWLDTETRGAGFSSLGFREADVPRAQRFTQAQRVAVSPSAKLADATRAYQQADAAAIKAEVSVNGALKNGTANQRATYAGQVKKAEEARAAANKLELAARANVTERYPNAGLSPITQDMHGVLHTEASSGTIEAAVDQAVALAKVSNKPVVLTANGQQFTARPGATAAEVLKPFTDAKLAAEVAATRAHAVKALPDAERIAAQAEAAAVKAQAAVNPRLQNGTATQQATYAGQLAKAKETSEFAIDRRIDAQIMRLAVDDVSKQYPDFDFARIAESADGSLKVDAVSGSFTDFVKKSVELATSSGKTVNITGNGMKLTARPGASVSEVMQPYTEARAAAQAAAVVANQAKLAAQTATARAAAAKALPDVERIAAQAEAAAQRAHAAVNPSLANGTAAQRATYEGQLAKAKATRDFAVNRRVDADLTRLAVDDVSQQYPTFDFARIAEGPDGSLNVDAVSGSFNDFVKRAIELSNSAGKTVNITGNGQRLTARPGSTLSEVMKPVTDARAALEAAAAAARSTAGKSLEQAQRVAQQAQASAREATAAINPSLEHGTATQRATFAGQVKKAEEAQAFAAARAADVRALSAATVKDVSAQYANSGLFGITEDLSGTLHSSLVSGTLEAGIDKAVALANASGKTVQVEGNGTLFTAPPGSTTAQVMKQFNDAKVAAEVAVTRAHAAKALPDAQRIAAQAEVAAQKAQAAVNPKLKDGTATQQKTYGSQVAKAQETKLTAMQRAKDVRDLQSAIDDVTREYPNAGLGRIRANDDGSLRVSASQGSLDDAAKKAFALANNSGKPVKLEVNGQIITAQPGANFNAPLFTNASFAAKPAATQSVISSASSFQPVVVEQGADQLVAALKAAPPHTFANGPKFAFKPVELDGAALTADTANLEGALKQVVTDLRAQGCDVPAPKAGEGLWDYLHRSADNEIWSKDNFLVKPTVVLRNFERYLNNFGPNNSRGTEIFDLGHNRIPSRLAETPVTGVDLSRSPNVNVVFALDGPLTQSGARALERLHTSRPELLHIQN